MCMVGFFRRSRAQTEVKGFDTDLHREADCSGADPAGMKQAENRMVHQTVRGAPAVEEILAMVGI